MIENSKTIPHELLGIKWSEIHYWMIKKMMDGSAYTLDDLKGYDKFAQYGTVQEHIRLIRRKMEHTIYRIYSGHEKKRLVYRLLKILPTALS